MITFLHSYRIIYTGNLLGGLTILLVHGKEEKRQHQPDHQDDRSIVADGGAGEQICRDTDGSCNGKTNKLAFGEVEGHLGLNSCQILGYGYEGHVFTTSCLRARNSGLLASPFPLFLMCYTYAILAAQRRS